MKIPDNSMNGAFKVATGGGTKEFLQPKVMCTCYQGVYTKAVWLHMVLMLQD